MALSCPAWAQTSASDSAAAQALFEEGRTLLAAGNSKDACPKFEESQRLDPGVGTQFHLADCYEQAGRTASAWTLFLEVAAATKKAGQKDREAMARGRAEALRPKLSRMVIQVPKASSVEGLVVERDGVLVGKAQWGLAVPVDPGAHTIRVSAPAKKAWETRVEVEPGNQVMTLSVPVLTDAPASETVGEAPDGVSADTGVASSSGMSTQRMLAFGSFGVAAIGVGVGAVFGLQAMSKNDDSNAEGQCDGNRCTPSGAALRDDARSAGNLSTIGFAVGGAGLIAGVLLWVLEPAPATTGSVAWTAWATPGGGRVGFGGAF